MHRKENADDAGIRGRRKIRQGLSLLRPRKFRRGDPRRTDHFRRSVGLRGAGFEKGKATAEKLLSAESIERAIEIQAAYLRQAYEDFVTESARMSLLYLDMAKDAYAPFEQLVAKAR
jgi:hypothetical protein